MVTTIAAAIFVKTPGLSPLKTRLASTVGQKQAETFYRMSASAVAEVVQEYARQEQKVALQPVYAVAEEAGLSCPLWQGFPRVLQGDGGLGSRLQEVSDKLLKAYDGFMFLGADCPVVTSSILSQARSLMEGGRPVIGPAVDGGFYLYGGLGKAQTGFWSEITYSESTTLRELQAQLCSRKLDYGLLGELGDVDTEEDLARLANALSNLEPLPRQRLLRNWIYENGYAS